MSLLQRFAAAAGRLSATAACFSVVARLSGAVDRRRALDVAVDGGST